MDANIFKLAELVMVMVAVGGFLLWQWFDVRKAKADTTPSATFTGANRQAGSASTPGHAEGQQELHPRG
jgi:hypothetical protein